MVASVNSTPDSITIDPPRALFAFPNLTGDSYPYDVTADGQRFLMLEQLSYWASPLTVVVNWLAAAKK
jgi:hypothetical protein